MSEESQRPHTIRFGTFAADLRTGELRKEGTPVQLQPQPFHVLAELVSRPGEIVSKRRAHAVSTESLATIDPKTLVRFVHHKGGGELDEEQGAKIAEHFGAGRYLLGSIVANGELLRIHAKTYETTTGRVDARASVEGEHNDLFDLVDDLTVQILVGEFPGPRGHNPRVAAMTTESLEALKAFLEGDKAAWRLGARDHEKAYRCFQRAVEIDPTFSLAW